MGIVKDEKIVRPSWVQRCFLWKDIDKASFIVTLAILCIGIIYVYSTTMYSSVFWKEKPAYETALRQFIFAIIGLVGYFIILHIPSKIYRKNWIIIVGITIIMMVIPLFGEKINGARRWVQIGESFQFQPAEIAKLAIIIMWSSVLMTNTESFKVRWRLLKRKKAGGRAYLRRIWKSWGVPIILTIIFGILYRLQSDNGSLIISVMLVFVMLFASGGLPRHSLKFFVGGVTIVVAGIFGMFMYIGSLDPKTLVEGGNQNYVFARFSAWVNPFLDYAGSGYQVSNSLIAISRGGLFGVGLGKGTQKKGYLTDGHNDFIMANIFEEGGLLTVCFIYVLYVTIILRGYRIARESSNNFAKMAVTGVITLFFIQAFWNSAGIVGLLPLKGLTAPLVSYGGTSLIIVLSSLAFVQRIHIENKRIAKKRSEKDGA
ncbi:MAG: FtsW/RodA/SpoVE family cell cycle protein [Culicoidibacterales bacterium]